MESSVISKVLGTRPGRIVLVIVAWFFVRETALRTNGFEDGPIVCPVRLLTGFPCPGCGGTRAIGAICSGQFDQAWVLNPLAFIVVAIILAWALRITPLNNLVRKTSSAFRSLPLTAQVLSLLIIYVIAWIAAISRFNSGIF